VAALLDYYPLYIPNSELFPKKLVEREHIATLRGTREYLTGLRERHKACQKTNTTNPTEREIVIVKGDDNNQNIWKLGKVVHLIISKDGIV
jgi:hypothetical protein